jgi:hypothetical protein
VSDPVIERFLRHIREATAFRNRLDRPDYELRDSLWAQYMREVATATPGDRERIERAIRVGTGA